MNSIDSFLLVISTLIVIVIGLLLLKRAVPLHWRRLTLVTIPYYSYILLILIPSIWIAFYENPPEWYLTLGLVLSAAAAIPLGVFTANAVWDSRPQEIEIFYTLPPEPLLPWQRKRLWILTGMVIVFSIFFFWETGSVPLLEAFFHPGEYHLLIQLRQSVTTDLRSPFSYFYFMIRQFGWAFVLSCWLGVAWTEHWTWKGWLGFLVLFGFGLFYCSSTLVRSPGVVLFIVILFFYYLFQGGRIPISRLFLVSLLAFVVPIGVFFLHNPLRSWESILSGIGQRIFYAPAKLNFQYVEVFPEKVDFLYGRGIGKVSQVVSLFNPSYEYFPISQEVYRYLFPHSPYRGSAPAPFVGMAYANWGPLGPALHGLMLGFILETVQIWLIRQQKNLFVLAAHAVLFYSFFEINRTDLFAVLFSYGGLLVPFGLVFLLARWNMPIYTSKRTPSCEGLFSSEV